jgi:uncharacterized membrane protein YphA (DoxX/SURF4 family)
MNGIDDDLILAARLLLTTLFLIFGWRKLRDSRRAAIFAILTAISLKSGKAIRASLTARRHDA